MSALCGDKTCVPCGLLRHMESLTSAGCPPEQLVQMVLAALIQAVGDTVEIHTVMVEGDVNRGTMH